MDRFQIVGLVGRETVVGVGGKSDWPLKSACCLVSRISIYEKVPKKRNLASLVSGTAFRGFSMYFGADGQ